MDRRLAMSNAAVLAPAPTLLIVEDHAMVRESLMDVLAQRFPRVILWEADSLAHALARVALVAPDVIVLDLSLDDASGFTALGQMRKRCPTSFIVVLSGSVDHGLMPLVLEMGADACVFKAGRRQSLLDVLVPWLGQDRVAPASLQNMRQTRTSLTAQQLMVLELILGGRSNKEIARKTGLAPGTVRNYVSALLATFGVATRSQLLALFGQ
jgi:DNA-binding NarL/FixJ family response regulator